MLGCEGLTDLEWASASCALAKAAADWKDGGPSCGGGAVEYDTLLD